MSGDGGKAVRDVSQVPHLRDVETAEFDLGADAEPDEPVQDLEEDERGAEGPREADGRADDLGRELTPGSRNYSVPLGNQRLSEPCGG